MPRLPFSCTVAATPLVRPGPKWYRSIRSGPLNSFVVFTAARMMHTGDLFQSMNMPFIDFVNSGGSATGFAATLSKAVAGVSGVAGADHLQAIYDGR